MSSFTLLDDPTESTALSKSKGNECFSEKLYEDAIFHYTDAIDSFEKAGTSNDPYLSLLYNNRATSFANIKKHGRAINDAKKAIKLDSANPKFFWRLSASLSAIGNFAAAKTQAEAGLKLNPENIPLLKLQRDSKRKIKEASVSANARAAKEIKGTKPAKSIDLGGLYGDKGGKHASSREIIAQLKAELTSGKINTTHNSFKGVFSKLMNASTFQQTIFPGLSNEAKMHAPKSLHEFLNNDTYEEEMASRGIPDARKKAEEVLISVKKKGAAAGQFMDPQTEASLWPQIMQEAIAHQVVNVVNRVHKRAHSSLGINAAVLTAVCCALDLNDSNVLAEPIALPDQMLEMARNILPQSTNLGGKDDNSDDSEDDSVVEQLPFEAIEGLLVVPNLPAPRMKELCSHSPSSGLSTGSGYVVVDDLIGDFDFFGPSIRRDCERLLQTDRLSTIPVLQKPRGGSSNSNDGDKGDDGGDSNVEDGSLLGAGYGKIAWVDGKELENNYASVSEVIRNLRNLPLELNEKATERFRQETNELRDSGKNSIGDREMMLLKLSNPMGNTTSVSFMGSGDRQPERLDSGDKDDVGHAVSCLYFCKVEGVSKGSGALKLTNVSDESTSTIECKADRLVMWRSKDVLNERLPIKLSDDSNNGGIFAVHLWFHGCVTTPDAIAEAVGRLAATKKNTAAAEGTTEAAATSSMSQDA